MEHKDIFNVWLFTRKHWEIPLSYLTVIIHLFRKHFTATLKFSFNTTHRVSTHHKRPLFSMKLKLPISENRPL